MCTCTERVCSSVFPAPPLSLCVRVCSNVQMFNNLYLHKFGLCTLFSRCCLISCWCAVAAVVVVSVAVVTWAISCLVQHKKTPISPALKCEEHDQRRRAYRCQPATSLIYLYFQTYIIFANLCIKIIIYTSSPYHPYHPCHPYIEHNRKYGMSCGIDR